MQSMDQAWALFEDELQEGPYLLGATYSVVKGIWANTSLTTIAQH